MPGFQQGKWENVFYKFFDTNRNKLLEWEDFELLFEKIKDLRGEQSQEYRIISDGMRGVYMGLLQDVKGLNVTEKVDIKETVTIEQWNAMWKKFDPKHIHMWQKDYLTYMFLLVDTSGDKLIDAGEYATVMKLFGMTDDECKDAFNKFAIDKDGHKKETIDFGDFTRLWIEYFTSQEAHAPGSSLFGAAY